MSTQTTIVPTKNVHPDPNQPRKFFDVVALAGLEKSIKKHGIVNPIVVEEAENGYLIIDGERRYRCAVELGLKEVPIHVIESKDAVSRLVEQFHIQEMHQAWSPMEKAQVISDLVDQLQKPFKEVCEILGIQSRTAAKYQALARLKSKKEFTVNNISLDFAESIHQVTNWVKDFKEKEMNETFSVPEQKEFQVALIKNIKDGVLTNVHSFAKLKDIFKNQPNNIKNFVEGANVDEMYIKSKARSAYYLRNSVGSAVLMSTNINSFLQRPDTKLTDSDVSALKSAKRKITEILSLAGKDE